MEFRATEEDFVSKGRQEGKEGREEKPKVFIYFDFVILDLFFLGHGQTTQCERTAFNSFSFACLAALLQFVAKRT